jgi:UDP-3-O-[3-hydroxymyristoyl] glucosamine N-acyltransferase
VNYRLKDGINIEEVRRKGKEFAEKKDRLGFARYLHTVVGRQPWPPLPEDIETGDNTTIGGDGFGYVKNEYDEWEEIPHVGRVVIGDNVRIGDNCCVDRGTVEDTVIGDGTNCCVDRGTVEDTVIGDGTKIDNMVHIAHNCKIGKNVIICAGVTFCGSVTVEDDVWLAPGTLIKEGVTIGKGARTGLGAVVIEDVPPNTLVYGVPAKVKE